MSLHTKKGRPLQVSGDIVYSKSGKVVGRIDGDKVYGMNGRYVGTIAEGRLVYRAADSTRVGSRFTASNRAGSGQCNSSESGVAGSEPDIPD